MDDKKPKLPLISRLISRPAARQQRPKERAQPEKRLVTKRQAAYLADASGLREADLAGKSIAELQDSLRWRIDPALFFFRKICGRVVKADPVTGELHGVPNATVHVEDTDCSFLGLFPVESPWAWLFPISCHTEEIATVTTDHCGHFCVWVPRWDIDRILRIRRERHCLSDFVKPTIRDILERIHQEPKEHPIRDPRPQPDPPPFVFERGEALMAAGQTLGQKVVDRLALLGARSEFGASIGQLHTLLDSPAFPSAPPPPLSPDQTLRRAEHAGGAHGERDHGGPMGVSRDLTDLKLRIDPKRYVGPFLRCHDRFVIEWVSILDVPDITFRVTQDVDGDGDEETIYSEGFFDVRWNAGEIPDVVLHAGPTALSTPICDGPTEGIDCQDDPAIVTAGLMPLLASHHDVTTGYALRPNRPRLSGLHDFGTTPFEPQGEAPYLGTIQLHGCQRVQSAAFYRLRYSLEGAGRVPFTGLEWWAPRLLTGPPIHVTADGDGWYPVLNPADLIFPFWLLNWETWRFPNGHYSVTLQVADAARSPLAESDPIAFEIDNRPPEAGFTEIRWKVKGVGDWSTATLLPDTCPIIRRPASDIELRVQWWAHAVHFRDAVLSAYGCDGASLVRPAGAAVFDYEHWHQNPGDNSMTRTALFELPAFRPEGVYHVAIDAFGRGFNPAGSDGGPGSDWLYEPAYSAAYPRRDIAVINL